VPSFLLEHNIHIPDASLVFSKDLKHFQQKWPTSFQTFSHTVKKGYRFPFPSWDVTYQTLPLAGNNSIIPGQEEFGYWHGDKKITNLFRTVQYAFFLS
jgi:hypothetical protein